MLNQWLSFLFQGSVGLVIGFAMDSMQPIRKNAPPKWLRVVTWFVLLAAGNLYKIFYNDVDAGINIAGWVMSLTVILISYRFFYQTSFWRQVFLTLILILAAASAEMAAALVVWLQQLPRLSIDYTQADMMLASLIGSFSSNLLVFLAAVLWRRFRLQKRMPRGSWAFVLMPLCLIVPTAIYCIETVQNNGRFSFLHVISMGGTLILNLLLICVQFNQAEKDEVEKELLALRHQTDLMRQHYRNVEARREEMAKIRHDYNNHLTSVLGLLQMGEFSQAEQTVKSLITKIEQTRESPYCGIPVVNAILSEKAAECRSAEIRLHADLLFAEDVAVAPLDLCSIFANLLDNAIRACTQLPSEQPRCIDLNVAM